MGTIPVRGDNEDLVAKRMAALGIKEADLEETFVRSGGHGGQNVNKTSTCVMLLHRPTGLQVKCQTTRQQGMNRVLARTMLLDKIEAERRIQREAAQAAMEKERRRKRGRSRAAKQRILANKAHQSQKKRQRSHQHAD